MVVDVVTQLARELKEWRCRERGGGAEAVSARAMHDTFRRVGCFCYLVVYVTVFMCVELRHNAAVGGCLNKHSLTLRRIAVRVGVKMCAHFWLRYNHHWTHFQAKSYRPRTLCQINRCWIWHEVIKIGLVMYTTSRRKVNGNVCNTDLGD